MRIPWPTDGGPILFQHGFEDLQARRDDQLLELGLRLNEDIDQRQVPWRRGYRLATARDCARLLLHGGSLLGGLHLGFVTGRIARPVKSRRFTFQQLLGHPPSVIPETGETAGAVGRDKVIWTVDPTRLGGVVATANRELRLTLLHEFHHLVRGCCGEAQFTSYMDHVINEGMATVFERDVGGVQPPWGEYPDDLADWVLEIMAWPTHPGDNPEWMTRQLDGRRWMEHKTGAYLVDQAISASAKSAADFALTPTEEIIRLAGFASPSMAR